MATTQPYSDLSIDVGERPRRTNCRNSAILVIVAIAVIIVAVIALAVPLGVIRSRSSTNAGYQTTTNAAIDESADPCTDFYQFSCGNWVEDAVIPPSSKLYGNFDVLTMLNIQDLEYAILNKLNAGKNIKSLIKLSNLYKSCIKSSAKDFQLSPKSILSKIGGWPLLNISNGNGTSWALNGEQFIQEKLLNSPAFFSLYQYINPINRTKRSIYVKNSGLTFPDPSLYADSSLLQDLKRLIADTLQTLNPDNSYDYYKAAAQKIVEIEIALAKISPDILGAKNYTITTLESLGSVWADYHWVQQISTILNRIGINNTSPSEPIVLYGMHYFEQSSFVLRSFSPQHLQDYAKWQLLYYWMPFLKQDMANLYYEFQRLTNPSSPVPLTWNEQCMQDVQRMMPYALGRVFAQYLLHNNSKNAASLMMTNIMQAFRDRIGSRSWLDKKTISVAQDKIDQMISNIAYPDLIFNDQWLDSMYDNLTISQDSYATNVESFVFNKMPSSLGLLREPFDNWDQINPTVVNAIYIPMLNEIYILEGIMREPFFNPEWPLYDKDIKYFQYGSLGVVLGHEITHGFDNNGRLYNALGEFTPNLWTQKAIHNFVSLQQCYVKEYSGLSLFDIYDNGTSTLGENIADNGGLIAAYTAYQMAKQNGAKITYLPSLDYTDEQMFFIAFGQTWCSYYTREAVQYLVQKDVHSPEPLRVIGTLRNSVEFANAFKCPVGSPMNPSKKCSLW